MTGDAIRSLTRTKAQEPVLLDGGTGSLLLARIGGNAVPSPLFNLSHPADVVAVHRAFVVSGAQIVVANTFCASGPYLEPWGKVTDMDALNAAAVKLAHEAVNGTGCRDIVVAGSVAPLTPLLSEEMQSIAFEEQIESLVSHGAEMILCETFLDARQGVRAADAARQVMNRHERRLPVVLSMVPPDDGEVPSDWQMLADAVKEGRIDLFGLNCGMELTHVERVLPKLRGFGPLWLKPGVAPDSDGGGFVGRLLGLMRSYEVAAVGGCCGVTPETIAELRTALAHGVATA